MSSFSTRFLCGNPELEAAEIASGHYEDVGFSPAALPDSPDLEREMAEAFGWDAPPTEDEMEADYASRRCDEAELLAKWAGIPNLPDEQLVAIIADGPFTLPGEDPDEIIAAAAIELERRLTARGVLPVTG